MIKHFFLQCVNIHKFIVIVHITLCNETVDIMHTPCLLDWVKRSDIEIVQISIN